MPTIIHNHRRERRSCDVLKYLNYAVAFAVIVFIFMISKLSSSGGADNKKTGTSIKTANTHFDPQPYRYNPIVPQDDDFYNTNINYVEDDDTAADQIGSDVGDQTATTTPDDDESTSNTTLDAIAKPLKLQVDQDHPFVEQYCDIRRGDSNGTSEDWWPSGHSWKTRTPFFLLIGAKKGGTTSLSSWLNYHPLIAPPRTKELLTFLPNRMKQIDSMTNKILVNEVRADMYEQDYNVEKLENNDAMITFEATPGYLLFSTISRISILCTMPWVKLLVTLRHPVDRVFSHYNFLIDARMKREARTGLKIGRMPTLDVFVNQDMALLKQAGVIGSKALSTKTPAPGSREERKAWTAYQGIIGGIKEAPVGRSLYILQLQEWYDGLRELGRDPETDMLVVRNEDMKSDPDSVYQTILWWLELPAFAPPLGYNSQMVTQYRSEPMSNETRVMLEKFYKPYNKRLFDLLGWDEDVWKHKTVNEVAKEKEIETEEDYEEEETEAMEDNLNSTELAHIYDPPNYDEVRGTNFTNQWCVLDKVSWYPPPNKQWQLRAPYFILPGAKKSGTTSLASYLTQHPNVQPARQKELQFFMNKNFRAGYVTDERKTKVREAREHLYSMEFHSQALKRNNTLISMDATPGYLFYSSMLPQRILCVAPWIKLVVILRNPIDRSYSNWAFVLRRNRISPGKGPTFEAYIQQDMNALKGSGFVTATTPEDEAVAWKTYLARVMEGPIGRSMYEIQLRQWFQAIRDVGRDPKTQVYIVRSEDLKKDKQGEMKKLHKFLGLEYVPVQHEDEKVVSHYSSPMMNETRQQLEEFYAPYNKRLYKLLIDNGFGEDWDGFWDPLTKTSH